MKPHTYRRGPGRQAGPGPLNTSDRLLKIGAGRRQQHRRATGSQRGPRGLESSLEGSQECFFSTAAAQDKMAGATD
ncbi:hypothetical protein NDU88_003089 [Pleurodeles waltl]|uniref:Uncharacterized protein n=1 Tax=Pleurodeles waltl TaxID=8319 RepID=A0AAV7QAT3_PLEWA|nr:hypothetical protein NDU88_003089 [Pleurodeles waltl]